MSVEVLATSLDNTRARAEMRRRGLDFLTPRIARLMRKVHLLPGVNIGLRQKSWDVLMTLQFMEQHVDKAARILDLGAYSSEILLSLHKLGFTDLTGIDLDPQVKLMPNGQSIKYVAGDFNKTAFASETFGAITAISVLEHGFSATKVFSEISRVLKTGGYFIGSTDYWPEKIDTGDIRLYGLDWTIFSKKELLSFIEEAGKSGLAPVGQLNLQASEVTVRSLKRKYTFAWFVFQKVKHQSPGA